MAKDIIMTDRGLEIATSDTLHVEDVIRTDVGHCKWAPLFGIGGIRTHQCPRTPTATQDTLQALRIQSKALQIPIQRIYIDKNQWHIRLTPYDPTKAS